MKLPFVFTGALTFFLNIEADRKHMLPTHTYIMYFHMALMLLKTLVAAVSPSFHWTLSAAIDRSARFSSPPFGRPVRQLRRIRVATGRCAAMCGARRRDNRSLWCAHTRLQVASATKDDL